MNTVNVIKVLLFPLLLLALTGCASSPVIQSDFRLNKKPPATATYEVVVTGVGADISAEDCARMEGSISRIFAAHQLSAIPFPAQQEVTHSLQVFLQRIEASGGPRRPSPSLAAAAADQESFVSSHAVRQNASLRARNVAASFDRTESPQLLVLFAVFGKQETLALSSGATPPEPMMDAVFQVELSGDLLDPMLFEKLCDATATKILEAQKGTNDSDASPASRAKVQNASNTGKPRE